ncbi:MAG: DsrE family protein [Gammaproteobacteria bacterium]|jgi:predicted peroxiredoxin
MTTKMDNQQKFLINCSYGEKDLERATVSFVLALSAASHNAETAVFATSDAADLCVKGGTDNLMASGYEPLSGLVDDFIDNGGMIWLCPVCAKAKGIRDEDLRPGVEIAGAPRTMEFMASGAQLLA